MTAALLGLSFLRELGLLAAMAVVGFTAFDGGVAGIVAASVLVVAVAFLWGVLLAPHRRVDLPLAVRVCLEVTLFAASSLGLAACGYLAWGVALFVGEVVVLGALALRGISPGQEPEGLVTRPGRSSGT
jgi:hypothetical protein